jgi:hypothetical protein
LLILGVALGRLHLPTAGDNASAQNDESLEHLSHRGCVPAAGSPEHSSSKLRPVSSTLRVELRAIALLECGAPASKIAAVWIPVRALFRIAAWALSWIAAASVVCVAEVSGRRARGRHG